MCECMWMEGRRRVGTLGDTEEVRGVGMLGGVEGGSGVGVL